MIHYTPLPLEDVFAGWDRSPKALRQIVVDGITMQVEPINEQEAKIVRIISSDPKHYLDPTLAPGQLISFTPTLKKHE